MAITTLLVIDHVMFATNNYLEITPISSQGLIRVPTGAAATNNYHLEMTPISSHGAGAAYYP